MLFKRKGKSNVNFYLTVNYSHYLREEACPLLIEKGLEYFNLRKGAYKMVRFPEFRIFKTFNLCFNSKKINFDLEIASNVIFDRIMDTPEFHVFLQCEMELDEGYCRFKILDALSNPPMIRRLDRDILCDANLVPYFENQSEYDKQARYILEDYFPDGLKYAQDIPIEYIIKEGVGLKFIDYLSLSSDGTVLGQMNLTNDIVNGLELDGNTILIDKNITNMGKRRFVSAHELSHNILHKYCLILRKLCHGNSMNLIEKDKNVKNTKNEKESVYMKKLERQADYVAARILMPTCTFVSKLVDYYDRYNYFSCEDKERVLYIISKKIAEFFKVSRMAAAIRIDQVDFYRGGISVVDDTFLTRDEAYNTYNSNSFVHAAIDSGEYIFVNNHFVKNDSKYFDGDRITYYGFTHQNECMIHFTKQRHISNKFDDSNLYKIEITNELTARLNDESRFKSSFTKESIERLNKENEYQRFISSDPISSLRNIIEYKKVSYNYLVSMACVRKETISDIMNNITQDVSIAVAVKLCRALQLPIGITNQIISSIHHGVDNTIEDRMVYDYFIENYKNDCIPFCEEINNIVSDAEVITKENKNMIKEHYRVN